MKKLFVMAILLSLAGCSSIPVGEQNVSIVMAREASRESGATGVAESFKQDGKVYAYVTITWEPPAVSAGNKTVELRWYAGEKLITSRTLSTTLWNSPFYFWFSTSTTALVIGNNHVDCFVDGVFVGSKTFTITKT